MSAQVLILAPEQDVHTKAVLRQLEAFNAKTIIWSANKLPQQSLLRFELNSEASTTIIQSIDGGRFELGQFDAVWYRRPGMPKSAHLEQRWLEGLVAWESGRALEGIYRTVSDILWINNPRAQQETLIKVNQLKSARDAGFIVPDTLVTNDPIAVREFAERLSNQVVYKLIDEASWQYFPEYELPRGIPTLSFRATDLHHLDQVKLSLHLFQKKIDKVYDLRITVVGQEIFAVKIEPQSDGAQLDWRLDRNNKLSAYTLDDEIKSKCLLLMRQLGLVYGAFDLCRSRDGGYVFLELNPAGQYLWLEEALNLPISYKLAALLAGVDVMSWH